MALVLCHLGPSGLWGHISLLDWWMLLCVDSFFIASAVDLDANEVDVVALSASMVAGGTVATSGARTGARDFNAGA